MPASEQAWKDFNDLKNCIDGLRHSTRMLHESINEFETLKAEIWTDPERMEGARKVADEHFEYTEEVIDGYNDKFEALKAWLESNEFI